MTDVIGAAAFEIRAIRPALKADVEIARREMERELKEAEKSARQAQRELQRAFADAGHSEFERSMRVIRNASQHTEKEVTDAADRVARDLKGRYRELGNDIGQTFRRISFAAQVAFAGITAYALKLAADAEEIEDSFAMVFGSATEDVRQFSEALADVAGRDAVVLRESMTRLQLVLTGTGVAADQAASLVQALTEAGVDAGSLFNTSDAEALQKIISGLTGETEPLKAFGVVINQAALEAELLRLGFEGNAAEASEAAKSIARANIILEKLSVAQGRAAQESNSATGATRRMTAEFNQAARDLGQQLLPAMTKLFGTTTDVLRAFNSLPGGVQVAGLAFLGLIAAGGPIAGLIANLNRVIKLARDTRTALIAAGAAGAGAGVGGAAAGAAGTVLGAPGVAVAGALTVGGSSERPSHLDELSQTEFANYVRDAQAAIDRQSNERIRNQLQEGLNQTIARRSAANAQLEAGAAAAVIAAAGGGVDGVIGGFELPPELRTPTGAADGSGSRASGASEADMAAARERLRIENELAVARAANDTRAVASLEEQLQIISLTEQFKRAGFENAEAEALAQITRLNEATALQEEIVRLGDAKIKQEDQLLEARERASRLDEDRLAHEIELAALSGDERAYRALVREERIRTRINQLLADKLVASRAEAESIALTEADAADRAFDIGQVREGFRYAFRDGIKAAIDGDLGGFFENLADRFTNRMLDNLADDLFDILMNAAGGLKGGGSGGGILSSILGLFSFGGGRAGGGPVHAGVRYRVGEHGPEDLIMPRDGYVIPNAALNSGGGGMAAARQTNVFDMRGAVVTEQLLREVEAKVAAGEVRIRRDVPSLAVGAVVDARSRRIIG